MKVIMRARVTVYEPMGQYQLKVEDMQPDGVGVLAMRLEQLKKKLEQEGLFDPAHKKPIPAMPRVIGVITSPTGAALRDIMDILGRRYPCAEVVLAPVLVQGDAAPAQLINAVNTFSVHQAADVLIIGRGGGSMEDLWAFNDEGLARAIYDCNIPVISAVGHETDVTICDFVSDLRAPTPSAAAELAVPDQKELTDMMLSTLRKAQSTLSARINMLSLDTEKLSKLVEARSPQITIDRREELLGALAVRLNNSVDMKYRLANAATQEMITKLEALSPLAVLGRGYARVTTENERNLTSVDDVEVGDTITIHLKDGKLTAAVTNK